MKDRRNYVGRPSEPEPVPEAPVENKNRTGHITGCELLNVRQEPDSSAFVVDMLTSSDSVMIREKNSTPDFFKVTTPKGISGYCMKKYIAFND